MTDLTKTTISLETMTGITYPIYYCEITERYFIRRLGRLLEVAYKGGKWTQTGEVIALEKETYCLYCEFHRIGIPAGRCEHPKGKPFRFTSDKEVFFSASPEHCPLIKVKEVQT